MQGIIQLPDDCITVGVKQISPFKWGAVYSSESCDFTGTETDFLNAGYGYAYRQLDKFTRIIIN